MEGEVKEIQMELAAIKRDRMDLFSRKQSKGFVLVSIYLRQYSMKIFVVLFY